MLDLDKRKKIIVGFDMGSNSFGVSIIERDSKKEIFKKVITSKDDNYINRVLEIGHELATTIRTEIYPYDHTIYVEKAPEGGRMGCVKCLNLMYGFVIALFPNRREVKPLQWRKMLYRNEDNLKNAGRDKLKSLAMKYYKMYNENEAINDDHAEANMIARYGAIIE